MGEESEHPRVDKVVSGQSCEDFASVAEASGPPKRSPSRRNPVEARQNAQRPRTQQPME